MKFKSEVLTQASGSIGGVTYSHNSGGMYRRARSIPTNPNSADQQAVRNAFGSISQAWRDTLTIAQRGGWSNYAAVSPVTDRFGDPLLLSGQQMYVRVNTTRQRMGLDRLDAFPVVPGLSTLTPPEVEISGGDGNYSISWDDSDAWALTDGGGLLIQSSRFVSPSINFMRSPFRKFTAIEGDTMTPPAGPDVSTTNGFGETPGGGTAGNAMFFRFVACDSTGRLSPVTNLRAISVGS